jgi:8-oxo-dGTP diphosphatase
MEFCLHPVDFPYSPYYVVCLCHQDGGFLIVDDPARGWVTPSGKVEPGESAERAARRETLEEAGATLADLHAFGVYRLERGEVVRYADVFFGDVAEVDQPGEGEVRVVMLEGLAELYAGWNPLFERVFSESLSVRTQESATPQAW